MLNPNDVNTTKCIDNVVKYMSNKRKVDIYILVVVFFKNIIKFEISIDKRKWHMNFSEILDVGSNK